MFTFLEGLNVDELDRMLRDEIRELENRLQWRSFEDEVVESVCEDEPPKKKKSTRRVYTDSVGAEVMRHYVDDE
jgi:hypothetical protein